ncbi:MAG: hypothetical protein K2P81_08630, partial [Bacteriovoracaceae bacterium]|nr:hypothetical protein [Bacteriovoracaceae bacterium]
MTHLFACLFMLISFKAMSFAPQDVLKNLQAGLESQDQLLSFIQKRNCSAKALTTECQRPLTPVERSELQQLILDVEEWRSVWVSEILPSNNL